MKRTGAQIVWEALTREGVDLVFGHPGGAILPVYDAMPQYPVRHILARHEQGAGHMADGCARVTGKVGVAVVTSGPAATNLVTALATAMMDSVPIVAITGQVPTDLLGNDAFQETDVTGVTQAVTKHNYLVTDINDLARIMKEAFHIARTGRPGPVLVDICKDVLNDETDFAYPEEINLPGYHPYFGLDEKAVEEAAELRAEINRWASGEKSSAEEKFRIWNRIEDERCAAADKLAESLRKELIGACLAESARYTCDDPKFAEVLAPLPSAVRQMLVASDRHPASVLLERFSDYLKPLNNELLCDFLRRWVRQTPSAGERRADKTPADKTSESKSR